MIKIYKVAEKIFTIKEHYFSEYANIFIFKGLDFDIIFDIGVGIINPTDTIKTVSNNFKIIVTHIHFDHIGGLKYFDKNDILIPKNMEQTVNKKELFGLEYLQKSFLDNQLASIKNKTLDTLVQEYKNNFKTPEYKTFNENIIKNSNFCFEIISAPGHTDEGVMFWEKNKKILISGDSLYDGEPLFSFKNSSAKDLQKTLNTIKKLNPKIIFPGHNQILKDSEIKKTIESWENKITLKNYQK